MSMSRRSGRSKTYADQIEAPEFPEEDDTNNYEAEPEDEIEEEQEITRCVCTQDELITESVNAQLGELLHKEYHIRIDHGLFIQCDKCSVWQHGYCVGLFTNDEVPDKYWCELCKPELHMFIYENGETIRTLYRPVNDKRKKLSLDSLAAGQSTLPPNKSARSRAKRSAASSASPPSAASLAELKASRKERRHYDDSYDEQLQKALRESAKESGVPVNPDTKKEVNPENVNGASSPPTPTSSKDSNNSDGQSGSKRRIRSEAPEDASKRLKAENDGVNDSEANELDPSNLEDENDEVDSEHRRELATRRAKSRSARTGVSKPKKSRSSPHESTDETRHPRNYSAVPKINVPKASNGSSVPLSKDELTNQASKPRYVSEKSSIYELRKRTGAILEWLGRSQIELEEEKLNKIELFNYNDTETESHKQESEKVIKNFNENLKLMETLTESILNWEQKFGKFAP